MSEGELLIHALLEGEITPDQHRRLEDLLREDWELRRLYLELADQQARLLNQPAVNTGRLASPQGIKAEPKHWWVAAVVACALLLVGAIVQWARHPLPKEQTSDGVAMLSQILEAEFAGPSRRSGDTLAAGPITLKKGLAQIEFFSGATALIEGPAQVEIVSAWEMRCKSGRLRAHVPPAAKGFLIEAPGMKLEDLGTEFALNVNDDASAVHVFEGKVIARPDRGDPIDLVQGMSLGRTGNGQTQISKEGDFLAIKELQGLVKEGQARRLKAWESWSQTARKDPRLIAYYAFKHWEDDRWDRMVNNFAEPRKPGRAGGAVGARWTQGRWPGKEALEFKRPGDRVRLNLDGTYSALTMACWVKVDAVDKKYNSLLLTDGYENGEPHWQIHEHGSLMFSIMYRPDGAQKSARFNQTYYSKPVITADSLGRWHHLAVSYDNVSGEVIQYFDGDAVSREVSALHQAGRAVVLGPCEIGNWGLPTANHLFPIRNLNGAIDEFAIYGAVLSADEIAVMFEAGKP